MTIGKGERRCFYIAAGLKRDGVLAGEGLKVGAVLMSSSAVKSTTGTDEGEGIIHHNTKGGIAAYSASTPALV